jgi:hypothetical protein
MLKPMISDRVSIVATGRGEYRAVANDSILAGTVIEICPVMPMQCRHAVTIGKTIPAFDQKIIIDVDMIDREYRLFTELGELELESRLESGQISPDEYRKILSSKVDVNAILNLKSHNIPLGYGMVYQVSDFPNMIREYHSDSKLCLFKAVKYIESGTELTYSN